MEEVALPVAEEPKVSEVAPEEVKPTEQVEGDDKPAEEKPKAEKTPEQRELDRARRKIDRLVRQREELRAQVLTRQPIEADNRQEAGDSDRLTLSREELQKYVEAEAKKLAPTLKEQQAAIEHRQSVVQGLAKSWGQEKFDDYAKDLDEAFGGLTDKPVEQGGKAKPAVDAIFESDDPKSLIEYLTDEDHADEAEALSRMSPIQAGRAIAKLETKLAAEKAKDKPQPSKAAAPLEAVKASGTASGSDEYRSDFTPAQFAAWYKRQASKK